MKIHFQLSLQETFSEVNYLTNFVLCAIIQSESHNYAKKKKLQLD